VVDIGKNIEKIKSELINNNLNEVCKMVMQDSNNFHAICQDTFPPIFYLNDYSKEIINFVHKINSISQNHVT
jgi:diphosphomevalonate decarboxylase